MLVAGELAQAVAVAFEAGVAPERLATGRRQGGRSLGAGAIGAERHDRRPVRRGFGHRGARRPGPEHEALG